MRPGVILSAAVLFTILTFASGTAPGIGGRSAFACGQPNDANPCAVLSPSNLPIPTTLSAGQVTAAASTATGSSQYNQVPGGTTLYYPDGSIAYYDSSGALLQVNTNSTQPPPTATFDPSQALLAAPAVQSYSAPTIARSVVLTTVTSPTSQIGSVAGTVSISQTQSVLEPLARGPIVNGDGSRAFYNPDGSIVYFNAGGQQIAFAPFGSDSQTYSQLAPSP